MIYNTKKSKRDYISIRFSKNVFVFIRNIVESVCNRNNNC